MAAVARKTNWFAIWVSVAVVVVLVGVAALVVVMNNSSSAPAEAPKASNIDTETGAISFGDGSQTVDTFIDFICPYCNQFEQSEGSTINGLVQDGTITLNVHPLGVLDRASQGTEYSSRAASAMYAVAVRDPDNAYAFMQALFENQPAESTPGLTDEQIVDVAKQAGVNVTSDLENDITSHRYLKYVQTQTLPDGAQGTPTVLVNGNMIQVTFDPQKDIVANLLG